MRPLPRPAALTLAAALLVLAACDDPGIPLIGKPVVLPCPDYFILEEAATLTEFRPGPGRDITDVVVRAEMGEMRLICLTQVDKDTDSGVIEVEIAPLIAAEMGPANQSESATLPYFVVITDPDREILYREELTLDVSFAGNRTRLIARAPSTTVEMPITPEIRSGYYLVYGGFALSEDQVAYNRRQIQERLR